MPQNLSLIFCTGLVALLLYIEHKRNEQASFALWVPTFWVLIYVSRPLGMWFDKGLPSAEVSEASIEAGSPIERYVLTGLMIVTLLILFRRRIDWPRILKANLWLIIWFSYLAISILWSDIPFASFKRWFRSIGDVLVALVVLSELKPFQGLESVFRRCAYVLVPVSLMLVEFFPQLGREYGRTSGMTMWIGVTSQKNSLGQLCALAAFLLTWSLLREWRAGQLFRNEFRTLADALVLSIAVFLLIGPSNEARSATSISILIVGVAILLLVSLKKNLARYIAAHLKGIAVTLVVMYALFFESLVQTIAPMFGRESTLTGRTEIWDPLLNFASQSPVFGVGYGGFWAPGNRQLEELFSTRFNLTQAHNGYLAIYVELGVVGLALLGAFLLAYCNKVRREISRDFEWGVYGICILLMLLIQNISEASFMNSSSYLWITIVFLTVVFSATGVGKVQERTIYGKYRHSILRT